MSELTNRQKIAALLATVPGIGRTYDSFRLVDTIDQLHELYMKAGKVDVWQVKLADGNAITTRHWPGYKKVTYRYDLMGHRSFEDDKSTQAWAAFMDAVVDTFEANKKLRDLVTEDEADNHVIESGPPQLRDMLVVMLCGTVLAHHARLEFEVIEHVMTSP